MRFAVKVIPAFLSYGFSTHSPNLHTYFGPKRFFVAQSAYLVFDRLCVENRLYSASVIPGFKATSGSNAQPPAERGRFALNCTPRDRDESA